jgi:hypothetical protein
MDEERRVELDEHGDDEKAEADLPSSTLIGANIAGNNAGLYPGGVVAPASDTAEVEEVEEVEEAEATRKEEEEGDDLGPLNFDALAQFKNDADQGASTGQSETEAGKPNG